MAEAEVVPEEVQEVVEAPEPAEEVVVVEDVEKEVDAPQDNDRRYKDTIEMSCVDATLNCLVGEKNTIEPISVDGAPFLAASRATIGLTGGRYYFESQIINIRGNGLEAIIGFSAGGSSIYLGEKDTLGFSSNGSYTVDGEKTGFRGKRFGKDDVIGVLLNRTEEGNANTVSLFINGCRSGSPQEIPESLEGPLFPHVSIKMGTLSVNLTKHILKKLPFSVRLVSDANADDVTPSTIKEAESKVVVPMGIDTVEYIRNYTDAHVADHFVQITLSGITKWQEKSGVQRKNLDQDGLRCLERMMALRKRNYIYSIGNNLMASDRQALAKRFPASMKKTLVVCPAIISKLPFNGSISKEVTLPTAEEGFEIDHTDGEGKSKAALDLWQKKCKQQTIVAGLKTGEFFKESLAKWQKLRDATRAVSDKKKKELDEAARKAASGTDEKPAETPTPAPAEEAKKEDSVKPSDVDCHLFEDEDWMLADLRAELHLLVHAFRQDVEDKERVGFAADHLSHYYKLYHGAKKQFNIAMWGVKTVTECVEVINDTIKVEDGLLLAENDKDADFDTILQQTEDARQNRIDRIGAGDEGSRLKFKAPARQTHKNKGKGKNYQSFKGNNSKGQSRPVGSVCVMPMQRVPSQVSQPPIGKGKGKGAQSYMAKGSKGSSYQMRPVPQQGAATGYKRPQGPTSFHSAPKRPHF